ncbi:MAG: hypothetical protein JW818_06180 [Pirellulales bacterium]|nr:hypothetical protein [Pirellulales bacterium]
MLSILTLTLAISQSVRACDTPVYRYAIYNWAASPYHLFYLHEGPESSEEAKAKKALEAVAMEEPPANLELHEADVSDPKQKEMLPGLVAKAWAKHEPAGSPLYLVVSPTGQMLFSGQLDPATLRAMLDSPLRKRIARLLEEGNAAVLVLLTGPDAQANRQAKRTAQELIDQVKSFDRFEELADALRGTSATGKPQLAMVEVSRTDPKETWFVRNLLGVEDDLDEFPTEPMVFAVHGRGRTLLPYVGKGITLRNLGRCVLFLAGACSCEAKSGNPGADLLFRWDWDTTADTLASRDDGMPLAEGQLDYSEFMPTEPPRTTSSSDNPAPTAVLPTEVEANTVPPNEEIEKAVEAKPAESSFASRQMWLLGFGLAAATLVVLLAGIVLLRRA